MNHTGTSLRILGGLALFGLMGCYTGTDKLGGGGAPTRDSGAAGADGGGGSAGDDDGTDPTTPDDPEPDSPFEVPKDEVRLLPFHVRMANLVAVVGVPEEHAMFDELRAKRYQLGDHDYANGVAPDLDWNADRMETWVKAIKPVCNDPQFQARYPTLATDVVPLARAAFGRDPTADEIGAFDDVKLGQQDGAGQYRMVCLAVLTSLEFVAD